MTRFDIPESVKALINKAVEVDIIDAVEVYSLASEHGDNWMALVDDVVEMAFSHIHSTDGRKKHSAIVTLAEKIWKEMLK